MRRLWPLLCLWPGLALSEITVARYEQPTDIYGHGALPDGEWVALTLVLADGREIVAPLVEAVYEDTGPRLADLNGDGAPEVVTVISSFTQGAAIRIWGIIPPAHGALPAVLAETAPIGQRHRWLAIAGIADLDGDGRVEIAYVDRPHLARVLRIVTVDPDPAGWTLTEVASAEGHTNHRFGSPVIEGGLRDCGEGIEIITASADWSRLLASRLEGGAIVTRDIGPWTGTPADTRACP